MNENNLTIKDLRTYGVEQSGRNSGSIEAYKNFLDKFHSGNIAKDGDLQRKTEAEKQMIQRNIDDLERLNIGLQGRINQRQHSENLEKGQIPDNEKEIQQIDKEIYDIQNKSADSGKYKVFSLSNFLTLLFFIIPLCIYLLFFYTSIAYSAFYGLDPTSLVNGNTLSIPILPDFQDLLKALETNYMLIFVPSVFFAFGVVLHIFIESNSTFKHYQIVGLAIITLLADAFFAYKIHQQAIIALEYTMDKEQIPTFIELIWYRDINFYTVLILGFVAFLLWSIMFHSLKTEWKKRDVIQVRMQRIEYLRKQNRELRQEINTFESEIVANKLAIDTLQRSKDKESINIQTLQHNINDFTTGWCEYLAILNGSQKDTFIAEVNQVKSAFINSISTSI